MKLKRERPFRGTEQNLYSVATLAWNYCLASLALFAAKSPRYKEELVAQQLALAASAKALPTFNFLRDAFVTARQQLEKDNKAVLALWRQLKAYILVAYPPDLAESKLRAAGGDSYRKAANEE